jgi:phosphoribosylamine--glycine ligase
MRLLLVGAGGRENAMAWKFSQESGVEEVICAPGNAGMAMATNGKFGSRLRTRCVMVDSGDPAALLALAVREGVDFTIVGPELPLSLGVSDRFAEAGRPLFGPLQAAARLESSKAFSKEFMARHQIPTAQFRVCHNTDDAINACEAFGFPVVVKADGLAAGKGVTVAPDRQTAKAAVYEAMVDGRFGDAGTALVIEECLVGPEVSFFVVCDGRQGMVLPAAQDYKRVFDDDAGPNTGGMGAFAPSPLCSESLVDRVTREVVTPVLEGLRAEGTEYRGVLYVGLMLTPAGPKVIEFNVRFGDPEAQVVLPMVHTELTPVLLAAAKGDLNGIQWRVGSDPHVAVVVASGGYPGAYKTGFSIEGLTEAAALPDVLVFHAGSVLRNGVAVTSGGRVLTVVGRGQTFPEAIDAAYTGVGLISFPDKYYRTDIGKKALASQTTITGGEDA